jgi:TatD DNase family protein
VELIDTHAHTAFEAFDADRAEAYRRAREAGVAAVVEVGVGLEGSRRAVELARNEPLLRPAVGLHPAHPDAFERDWPEFEALVRREDVVAVGECGLDFHWMRAPREVQERAFRAQIGLARRMSLPYIVHCRAAEEALIAVLAEERYPRGVVHCFSGTPDQAERILALGLRISFCGNVTYKTNAALRETARVVPLDRLLLETDAPFLPPRSRRGERNEPAFVAETAAFLAKLHGVPLEELAKRTTANARRFFDLKPEGVRGTVVYRIGENLYVNLTRLCTAHCYFCPREGPDRVAWGHDLALERDPEAREVIEAVGDPTRYREVVFCGLGEPMIRLGTLLEVARALKARGARVRINTNGHGNLIHGRDVTPELRGLVDAVSISLNAQDAETYERDCPSTFGLNAFDGILDFARRAREHVPEVVFTVVEGAEGVDVERCREIAAACGVGFRARPLDDLKEDRRPPDER